jgi:hypothetical protein
MRPPCSRRSPAPRCSRCRGRRGALAQRTARRDGGSSRRVGSTRAHARFRGLRHAVLGRSPLTHADPRESDRARRVPRRSCSDRPPWAGSRRHPALARRDCRGPRSGSRSDAPGLARDGGPRSGLVRLFLAPAALTPRQTGIEHRAYIPLVGLRCSRRSGRRVRCASSAAPPSRSRPRSRSRFRPRCACPTSPTRSPSGRAPRAARRTRRSPRRAWHGATTTPVASRMPVAATRALAPRSRERRRTARGIAHAKRGDLSRARSPTCAAPSSSSPRASTRGRISQLQRPLGLPESEESQRRANELGASPRS